MSKLDIFRKALALPEVMNNVELSSKLKEAYTDYLELLEENSELKIKLKEFEDVSDIKKKAKVFAGFYTIDGIKDINGKEIPFCLNCLYEFNLQIPMAFGIVERGIMEMFSGQSVRPNVYGLTCHKCGTKLATYNDSINHEEL